MKIKCKKIKTGDVFEVIGGTATVVEYHGSYSVTIEHNDEHRHRMVVQASNLRRGMVKNPYTPLVYGVGYVGVGAHSAQENGKQTAAYRKWVKILERCYDDKFKAKNPAYSTCTVSQEWHCFQVFAEWFHAQPNSENAGFEIDKDLMVLGSEIYSDSTCSFVPQEINKMLNSCAASRGEYPLGVHLNRKRFMARVSINGESLCLGTYDTPDQAHAAYREAKKQYVRSAAEDRKDQLHPKVYASLSSWDV